MIIRMRSLVRLAPLALLALPFFACSSNKNYQERLDAAAMDPEYQKPFDQSLPKADYIVAAKTYPIGAGRKDPGSKAVDVAAAEKGYVFAWMWDAGETYARATFTYDDNTPQFVIPFRDPSNTGYSWGGWEPEPDPTDVTWQSPAAAAAVVDPAGRLKSAWRFRGGPFSEYGGGVGISMRTISNALAGVAMPRTNPSIALLEQTPSAEFPDPTAGAYDLSSYEGIAIWVRRGPDGQGSMRVGITERNSAEDLNSGAVKTIDATPPTGVVEGKYCKRWRICGCGAGTPCSLMPGQDPNADPTTLQYRCFDPAIHTPNNDDLADPYFQVKYPHCGVSRCALDKNSSTITPDPDPLFMTKTCNPDIESNGHSEMLCFDPATETPPSKRERCGNPFQRPINVSMDWQLIKVPFKDLRQADEAQVANDMDLHSVKQIAFTYTGGWIDYWVANLGFYKKAP